jgi:N-acetylglucosaminyldiphosphoundecaprenol N-acetyl-beta-D-mannosaminyltransferase
MGDLAMHVRNPFGLTLSMDSAREIVRAALRHAPEDGVALVVTPNIDHIARIRRSPSLARAYRNAARIVCDGWPVQVYARWCGIHIGRVTGCEITYELMRLAPYAKPQRLFFVVDSVVTQNAVWEWAARNGVFCDVAVPPFGFDRDAGYSAHLAGLIREHGTTLLIMAVGAPRSEVFVDSYRAVLPPCWAFCVGQAVKIELGLVRRASWRWQTLGMEWLWRTIQEPSRLTLRYVSASIGFSFAVVKDQLHNMREGRP